MGRNVFGWSYPPGCSGPPDHDEGPCEVCGLAVDDCKCVECPECSEFGNPRCYGTHLPMRSWGEDRATFLRAFEDNFCEGPQYDSCKNSPCPHASPDGCRSPAHPDNWKGSQGEKEEDLIDLYFAHHRPEGMVMLFSIERAFKLTMHRFVSIHKTSPTPSDKAAILEILVRAAGRIGSMTAGPCAPAGGGEMRCLDKETIKTILED